MTRTTIAVAAGLAFAATLPATSAHAAARERVFVASYGSDSNPCTFGSPCKTFQQAVNVVADNGEVTAIDSAGFGPINITKGITITSPVGVEAGIVPAAGGDAINIAAGTEAVVLRGLTLNGAGIGNGIVFNAGGSLTVTDCVVQNFSSDGSFMTGNGILMLPSGSMISFAITNTIVSNNGYGGIVYEPTIGSVATNGVIDHVVATNDLFGILINTVAAGGSTTVAISNSIGSNNSASGIYIANDSTPLNVSIDNTGISGNSTGIIAFNTSNVLLGRSVITASIETGINNSTTPNTFYSYKDNRINLNNNGSNVSGSPLVMVVQQ